MRTKTIMAIFFAGFIWLSSCGGTKKMDLKPLNLQSIEIDVAQKANNGEPIPVDIVFADNNETLKDLEGFTASGWFAVKETNLGDWESKTMIQSLEALPGRTIQITDFPEGAAQAVGVAIFTRYGNQALNRLIFAEIDEIELLLTPEGPKAENGNLYLLTSPPEPAQQGQRQRY